MTAQGNPHLEECCLRASSNVSDDRAAKNIQKDTGMSISASTQKRRLPVTLYR